MATVGTLARHRVQEQGFAITDVWRIVGSAIVGAVLFAGLALVQGAQYSATALVNAGPGDTASQPLSLPSDQLNRYVATEIVYIGTISQRISDNVTRDTGVTDPPPVTVTQDGNTNIIKMSMSADSAELAAAMADSAANSYIEDWKQRNPKDAQRSEDRYVVKASADTATRTNDPAITIGVGAALGLCVGVVWAYLRARWRLADEADTADTADTTDAADGPGERA
ncbi:MAG: hypothetical protein KDC39_14410 [Actinobacteria bacterium]|nr:hypothetical protein [Actinomycetota bacterium]HRY10197.1 hypothetical protein [Candidatus Nanopelagicales bacterium]